MMDKAKSIFAFVMGAIAWVSLIVLVWGILMNWFPHTNWIQQVAAAAVFAFVGLVTTTPKTQKKEKDDG